MIDITRPAGLHPSVPFKIENEYEDAKDNISSDTKSDNDIKVKPDYLNSVENGVSNPDYDFDEPDDDDFEDEME